MPEVQNYELVLHVVAACDYLSHAIPETVPNAEQLRERAHAISAGWRANDPAALLSAAGEDQEQGATLLVAIAEGMLELSARVAEWRGIDLS